MAAGWRVFTGRSPYPEIQADGFLPQYGPKRDRDFKISWIEGKRDLAKESSIMQWLSKLTGEQPPADADFGEWLQDGYVLCKLMNRLMPGSVPNVKQKGEYLVMENVINFRRAAIRFGLDDDDVFEVKHLWELSNLPHVAATIVNLSDLAHSRDRNIPPVGNFA